MHIIIAFADLLLVEFDSLNLKLLTIYFPEEIQFLSKCFHARFFCIY